MQMMLQADVSKARGLLYCYKVQVSTEENRVAVPRETKQDKYLSFKAVTDITGKTNTTSKMTREENEKRIERLKNIVLNMRRNLAAISSTTLTIPLYM